MIEDLTKSVTLDTQTENCQNDTRGAKVRLFVGKSHDFRDVRCEECGRLLYRELLKSGPVNRVIEIKCRKCGHLNVS